MTPSSVIYPLVLSVLPATLAQFITPPTDMKTAVGYGGYNVRYKEVPAGICETVNGVKSYSGYVDVAEDQHLFFWFFEARNQDPSTAPLTLWFNGGPGDPSTIGLFSENGPCWVDSSGIVQTNEYSWSNFSNVLYLDQPTDTGLSYSIPINAYTSDSGDVVEVPDAVCPSDAPADSCGTLSSANSSLTANSTPAAAPNVWRSLQGFMGAFPQYSSNGVHISTESYGGHYGPVFSQYILDQNAKNISGTTQIDLRSLSVGNGWFDPIIQYQAHYNFTVNPGNNFAFKPYNSSQEQDLYNLLYGSGNCYDQLISCNAGGIDDVCIAADNFCYDQVEYLYDTVTGRDEYDLRELSPDPFPYTHWVSYLNSPKVQQAVGAFTNFSYSATNLGAGTVSNAFATTGDDARTFNAIETTRNLVDAGVYVVYYVGDADYMCNWLGVENLSNLIAPPGYPTAGYENLTTSADGGAVYGVVKQAGKYAFARIYDSGHSVPFYQPAAALAVFERMVKGLDIASGGVSVAGGGYASVGPATSTYMNDVGTIQYAVVGEDCTYDTVTDLPVCP